MMRSATHSLSCAIYRGLQCSHHVVCSLLQVINVEEGTEKEGASSWRPTDVVAQSDVGEWCAPEP